MYRGGSMIEQDVNDLANAMEADPVRWAKNYLELRELVEILESQIGAMLGTKEKVH